MTVPLERSRRASYSYSRYVTYVKVDTKFWHVIFPAEGEAAQSQADENAQMC